MSDVSKAREVCESIVMAALVREPEMTLAALKGVPADRFKVLAFRQRLEQYRDLSVESLTHMRLLYKAEYDVIRRQPPAALVHRAIAAIAKGDEAAMWSLRWSGDGIAYAGPVVGQEV